jgi:catechol 2,3-dioxygenase-like lactoylglutathione lyase family enzyme
MFNVRLSDTSSVLFVSEPERPGHRVAFAVSAAEFTLIVERLRQRGAAFGNDPEDPTNGHTADVLGSQSRVYFRSPDGHLLEVTVST